MAIVRWINMACGTLLGVAALGFVIFLPGNLADYAREPEDVWLAGFWIALFGLLAALCFANAARANTVARWRTITNVGVIIALAALFLLGRDDPTVPPLVALCAVGPTLALIGMWRRSQLKQS